MPADSIFIRALRREPTPRRPAWLMRQAGRYLPEYRETRKRAGGFLNLVKTPELACEVALQPIARFGLDAAIVFSDILTIPDAMGLGLSFEEGSGPKLARPVRDERDAKRLRPPPPGELEYVAAACRETRRALPESVPLIGFCGSPFTLACYIAEGSGGDFWHARKMMRSRPDLFRMIVDANAAAVSDLLLAQAKAGCEALMIFDSWGGLLDRESYRAFSLAPMREAIAKVRSGTDGTDGSDAPVIVFSRGCGAFLEDIAECGCDCAGVDWQTSLSDARERIGERVSLQGNLDPSALAGDATTAKRAATKVLEAFGSGVGHIFNLGHGVDRRTPPENVATAVEAVQEFQS